MTYRLTFGFAALSAVQLFAAASKAPDQASPQAIRQSADKALAIMQKSIAAVTPNVPCASCHHNMVPLFAMSIARQHGVNIDAALERKVAARTYSFLADADRAIQGNQFVDPAVEGAELLGFAKAVGVPASVTTALHARRMATLQREDGKWESFDSRPPASSSRFMSTALAAKSVIDFAPEVAEPVAGKARAWLMKTQPVSVEDASFRVLGLLWTNASAGDIESAARDLAAMQQADGGWAQVKGRTSDAYATGQAVAVLKLSGVKINVSRGVDFLLKTQSADGSWLVKTRLHEVAPISPPYMETGFPGGKDQIISMMGTTWAMLALAVQLPPVKVDPLPEIASARPADVPAWVAAAAYGDIASVEDVNAATAKGSTPLMAAIGNLSRVKALVERGADVNVRAKSGQTPMMAAAAYRGSAPVIRYLASKGADAKPVKGVQFNSNPLVYASMSGDVEAVRALVESGANPKQPMLMAGLVPMTPMMAAVMTGSVDVVREYLRGGFDPNAVEEIPLLSMAAISNRPEVAKALLEAGADPSVRDKYQWTAAQHAKAIEHDKPAVEQLLNR